MADDYGHSRSAGVGKVWKSAIPIITQKGDKCMEYGFVKVTPKQAAEWLKLNKKNRKLRDGVVKKYAADMRSGRWEEGNADPIVINSDGVLENGQHRLHAVIASGATVQMFVIRGAESAMGTYDIGAGRSTSDYLRIRGVNADARMIGIVRFVLNRYGFKQPSNAIVESYLKNHYDEIRVAHSVTGAGEAHALARTAACGAAAYAALRCGVDEDILREFFTVMNSGFMENPIQSAAITMRNIVLGMRQRGLSRAGGEMIRVDANAMCEKAISDFVDKRPRRKPYPTTGDLPYFPKMEGMDAEEAQELLGG